MKEPLNSFADRIIRNGEISEFIAMLLAKGVSVETIQKAAVPTCETCGRPLTQSDGDTKCVHCGFMPWS